MNQPVAPISLAQFDGSRVRFTPDRKVSVFDALEAIGIRKPRDTWAWLSQHQPEVVQLMGQHQFEGKGQRPTPVADETTFYQLCMVLPAKRVDDEVKQRVVAFRSWMADIIVRVRTADPALTADLIDRTENPVDLEKLGERIKSKTLVLSLQGEARERGMMRRFDYAKMNDENNVFITGNTANEIKSLRDTEITRDSFSTGELSLLNLTQHAQVTNLKIKDAQGAGEILGSNQEVRDDLRSFRDKYFGPKRRPADKRGQVPTITVQV